MASHMADLLKTLIRDDAFVMSKLRIEFRYVEGAPVWTIQVLPSDRPLFLHGSRGKEFYVRGAAPRSERLDGQEMARYLAGRFQGRGVTTVDGLIHSPLFKPVSGNTSPAATPARTRPFFSSPYARADVAGKAARRHTQPGGRS